MLTLLPRAALIGILGASAIFALAEAIHHAGLNPFAASDAPSPLASAQPASTIEARAGSGAGE